MEKFQIAREMARRNLRVADHMLTITYPLVKDTKLLLAVLENIFLAITNGMGAVLHYERLYKRIPPFHDTFESKYNMFVAKIVPKYKIKYAMGRETINMAQEIKDILIEHKNSPIEFSRKDEFVICSDNYRVKKITINKLKDFIAKTKIFLNDVEIITKESRVTRVMSRGALV